MDLDQFNMVPKAASRLLRARGHRREPFALFQSSRDAVALTGARFCTVTGFFGDSIRFRSNESVVNELLLLKARAAGAWQDRSILHR